MNRTRKNEARSFRKFFIPSSFKAAAGYLVVIAFLTFPLLIRSGFSLLGSFAGYHDLSWELWLQWLVKYSLFHMQPVNFTDMAHYPVGVNVLLDSANFLNPFLSSGLQVFFGLVRSYNILCVLALLFNAMGAYWLARYLLKDESAAFVSGMIYAFNPYILTEISYGRLLQASSGWIALYVLCLIKMLKNNTPAHVIRAAVCFSVVCLSSWYYGYFSLIFTGILVVYLIVNRGFDRLTGQKFIFLFLLSAILLFPFLSPFLRVGGGAGVTTIFGVSYPASDILSGKTPFYFSSLVANSLDLAFPLRNAHYILDISRKISPLTITLAVLAFGIFKKKPFFWGVCAVFFYLLCLGPYLKYGQDIVSLNGRIFPLPYLALYKYCPFFWMFRWPDRFLVFLMLALAVLCAYSLTAFYNARKIPVRGRMIVSAAFSLALLAEIPVLSLIPRFPLPVTSADVPVFYRQLAGEDMCAVIQYPFFSPGEERVYPEAVKYGYYQTVHEKKMLDGPCTLTGLDQPGQRELFSGNSFIRFLYDLQRDLSSAKPPDPGGLNELRLKGFKYLIVHNTFFPPALAGRINSRLAALLGKARMYPDGIAVYLIK